MNSRFVFRRNRLSQAIALAAGLAPLMAPTVAVAAGDRVIEEVVVTGSRIARANTSAPTPIISVDAMNIEMTGQLNTAEILRQLPAVGVSGISSSNSNFSTSGGGINTINLRNLGEDRTLVLVNGRRYISGLAGSAAVDFNTVPTELIDRVEVITGGASAIYGSDALAGVVNIILKDDFEGMQFTSQYGEQMKEGDDERLRLNLLMGGNFADDRGNAVMSATYSREDGVLSRDRKNTAVDDIAECLFTGNSDDCKTSRAPFFSSFAEGGRFFVPSTGASFAVIDGVGPNGTVVPWSTSAYGFNRQQFRRYTTPTERYLLSANMKYEINEHVESFVETTFARTETSTNLEPFPHSNSDLFSPGISVDNPFVPAALRNTILAAGDDVIEYFRRTTELDERGSDAERQTWRALFGLRGDYDGWKWDTFFGEGRMKDNQRGSGQLNISNMRNALDAIDGDGDPATFDPVCRDAAARAEGCSPINIFGRGAISAAAANYVKAPSLRDQSTEQTIAGLNVTRSLFDLPAGAVSVAFGGEYREESAADIPDSLTQTGQNAGNKEAETRGEYDVWEAYVEFEVPLLRDLPLMQELTFGGAYRYSDYSTIGNTDAYTARLSWVVMDALRLRGQYARAVRAPNVGELFSPGGENFAPVSDPCNGVTATTPGATADNCRSIPVIAQRIAATGAFTLTQTEIQGTGGFTGKGNPNLDTETSDSLIAGVVFEQDLGRVGSLLASIDWYSIEIEDTITTVGRQSSVNFCYVTATANFPNDFCGFVVRDTTGAAFQLGEITEVNSGFINEGTLETSGVDVQLSLSATLADWHNSLPGTLVTTVNYGYVDKFDEVQFGTKISSVGEVGYARNEWLASLLYRLGSLDVQWETKYIGDSVPSKSSPLYKFGVGEYVVHDIYAAYAFTDNLRVFVGVDNLLDEKAPIILSGVPGNTTGHDTNASVYNDIGRTMYAGLRVML
jgi:iron complex outermembrane recepter protein